MTRVFYESELEGLATFWRIYRRDGVAVGFTTHNRDIWFGGILHKAAPALLPSAIRRTADLDADSADVQGALAHDAIAAADLAVGRYDDAKVQIGIVDWETLENAILYSGSIGSISDEGGTFSAELRSTKAELEADPVPRTSPTCRAQFCGPGCLLPAQAFTLETVLSVVDREQNAVSFAGATPTSFFADGSVRWLDGPHAGSNMRVSAATGTTLVLEDPIDPLLQPGARALLRQGCDHTIATCSARFSNAINFQGEPFLPGNDLLTRYGQPSG